MGIPAWAMQVQDLEFISPITGKKFAVVAVPMSQATNDTSLADMGADDDGCRHSSGLSEYDYYVATCPYSYFSALSVEWNDKTGKFRGDLPPEMKDWVVKEFNSDWQVDVNHAFHTAQSIAKNQGQAPIDRADFVMTQQSMSLEKRYRYALMCYEKRAARPVVLAKVALTGAWALRARFNVPVNHNSLAGGYEEVNDKLSRKITDGESFNLAKWTEVYAEIFNKTRLSHEAYLVAGFVYLGFATRAGDSKLCQEIVSKMNDRFSDTEKEGELLRGLVRQRKNMLQEYEKFLNVAQINFTQAVRNEEFTRQRLPENILVTAECLRRTGKDAQAMDWYLTLAQMNEGQPKLRSDIRAQGKAPGPDAPYHVQLGWIADLHIQRLTDAGLVHPGVPAGIDREMLNAILHENFGSSEYKNPNWKPATGGNQQDCALVLDLIGKALLEYQFRLGNWPLALGELWEKDVLRDRNRVNRFNCPVTGKEIVYAAPGESLVKKTVLIATTASVPTNQGPRFGAYLANDALVWTEQALKPGDVYGQ
jgi:hypothetical protein